MNRNILAAKLAFIEGLAIGMQERLDNGDDLEEIKTEILVAAAQGVHDYAHQEGQ